MFAGLITTSTVTAIRCKRGDIPGWGRVAAEARDGAGLAAPEPDLEIPGRYLVRTREDVVESSRICVQAEDGDGVTAPERGLDVPGID